MANVHDVAALILQERGPMTGMKLQKLIYFCQAWSLVWDGKPLFPERIYAWMNGPVVKELYEAHPAGLEVREWPRGDPEQLADEEWETVLAVSDAYGHMKSQQLNGLIHRDMPWRDARKGLALSELGDHEITLESMRAYYSAPTEDLSSAQG